MRVLIVDDERRLCESLADYLAAATIDAEIAFDGLEGKRRLGEEPYDALVTDLRMPGMGGLALLEWVVGEGPDIPVVVISAHGEVRDAVAAMKTGAYDYLVKPFDPEELILRLTKAVEERRTRSSLAAGRRPGDSGFIAESPAMREVLRLVDKAAPSAATILITGESGTGKEVVARLVHERSGRKGAFVPVNMGALPESLMESELFGFEKGAFTGAERRKPGLFETAHGGTLFLDEIGEIPPRLQVKLLRAIQDRKVQRLGGLAQIPFDARIVAATNRKLEDEVRSGAFREDLYYRLNVIGIDLPPLRARTADIAPLARFFLAKVGTETGRRVEGLSPDALGALESYGFPGNVRELENVIERALILAEGPVLGPRDFLFSGNRRGEENQETHDAVPSRPKSLAEAERETIEAALARNGWHRERTAEELGITRRTLLNKIHEYSLEPPDR